MILRYLYCCKTWLNAIENFFKIIVVVKSVTNIFYENEFVLGFIENIEMFRRSIYHVKDCCIVYQKMLSRDNCLLLLSSDMVKTWIWKQIENVRHARQSRS